MTKLTITTCDQCKSKITNDEIWTVSYQGIYKEKDDLHFCNYQHLFDYMKEAELRVNKTGMTPADALKILIEHEKIIFKKKFLKWLHKRKETALFTEYNLITEIEEFLESMIVRDDD